MVTATQSFLDTMFLLTPENFPLECAMKERRRQQSWRSGKDDRACFHLGEEGAKPPPAAQVGADPGPASGGPNDWGRPGRLSGEGVGGGVGPASGSQAALPARAPSNF